jgi:integrase
MKPWLWLLHFGNSGRKSEKGGDRADLAAPLRFARKRTYLSDLYQAAEWLTLWGFLRDGETVGLPYDIDDAKRTAKHAPKEPNRRTKIGPHAAAAIRLLILTGARLREILHLKWDHVDLERGLLLLADSKTGKKAIVLNAPAMDILANLPRVGVYVIAGQAAGNNEDKPRVT